MCSLDFLLTEKAVSKDFNMLPSDAMSLVRYDGTLPFRAVINPVIAPEGQMPRKTLKKIFAQTTVVFTTSLCLLSTPVAAGPLETALFNATVPYVVLKRGSVECGKPDGEHIAYKQRVLNMLGRIPNVDLIVADREMERAFEREVAKYNPTCSDALLERYQYTMARGAEASIEALTHAVLDQLHQ